MNLVENKLTKDINQIISSKEFLPVFINGPTGCGKTFPLIKICEKHNIKNHFISITKHTDNDTLIGGLRLKNGETIFQKGPLLKAMENGEIVILDELDLADPTNIMCLQNILTEGHYYIEELDKNIYPKKGFNIFATGNTKGVGDDSGRYIGTNIQNEAFLDRFVLFYDIDYPIASIERKIISANVKTENNKFLENLIVWANEIRKTVKKTNEFQHVISTRKLIHIIKTYELFKNEKKSMVMTLSRFDNYHFDAFMNFYTAKFEFNDKNNSETTEVDSLLDQENLTKLYKKDIEKIK